jgi:hypothetical protein
MADRHWCHAGSRNAATRMRFVPSGRKATRARVKKAKIEARDVAIDRAVQAEWFAVHGTGLCLPMAVLLERVLSQVLPSRPFAAARLFVRYAR